MFFGVALIVGGWGVVGWCRISYLGPAEISPFSSQDLSRRNKHDSFWLVVLTGYFYILFSWAIVVSDFLLLGAVYIRKIVPTRRDVSPRLDEYYPRFIWENFFQRTQPIPHSLYAKALIRRLIFCREICFSGKIYKNRSN